MLQIYIRTERGFATQKRTCCPAKLGACKTRKENQQPSLNYLGVEDSGRLSGGCEARKRYDTFFSAGGHCIRLQTVLVASIACTKASTLYMKCQEDGSMQDAKDRQTRQDNSDSNSENEIVAIGSPCVGVVICWDAFCVVASTNLQCECVGYA